MAINTIEENIEKKIAERNISVQAKADKLIAMKKEVDVIEDEMEILKNQLKPIAEQNTIKTNEGSIVYVDGSISKYVTKDNVKQILTERLKLSEEVALKLIDAGASEKIISSYVKVLSK